MTTTMTIYYYLDKIDTWNDEELDTIIRLAEDGHDLKTDISLILNYDETVADYATQVEHQEYQAAEMEARYNKHHTKSLSEIAADQAIAKRTSSMSNAGSILAARIRATTKAKAIGCPKGSTLKEVVKRHHQHNVAASMKARLSS